MRLTSGYRAITLAAVTAAAAVSAGSALASSHVAHPTITGIFPSTASVGTNVMIAGTNLKGATSVMLGGVKVKFTVFTAKAIAATVPAQAKTGKLTITTKAGTVISKTVLTVLPFRHA
jgi:IPT/TIG domain-containing protein